MRYIGCTSQPLQKRLSDHLSLARWRSSQGKHLTPAMLWLLELEGIGLQPSIVQLHTRPTKEDAEVVEFALQLLIPTLNKPGQKGGRPAFTAS
jgi:hypothetical protein